MRQFSREVRIMKVVSYEGYMAHLIQANPGILLASEDESLEWNMPSSTS